MHNRITFGNRRTDPQDRQGPLVGANKVNERV